MLRKDRIEGLSDCPLRHGKSGTDRVCGVAEERENPFLSKLRQSLKICHITEYRGIVDLEVTGI